MFKALNYMSERELWWASFLVGIIMAAAVVVVGLIVYLLINLEPAVGSSLV